ELGMVGLEVGLELADDLLVSRSPCHVAALARDHPLHARSLLDHDSRQGLSLYCPKRWGKVGGERRREIASSALRPVRTRDRGAPARPGPSGPTGTSAARLPRAERRARCGPGRGHGGAMARDRSPDRAFGLAGARVEAPG